MLPPSNRACQSACLVIERKRNLYWQCYVAEVSRFAVGTGLTRAEAVEDWIREVKANPDPQALYPVKRRRSRK